MSDRDPTGSDSPLVTASALSDHMQGGGDMVLLDCRFDLMDPDAGAAAYGTGHIPGAHYAHLDDDLAGPVGPTTGRHPLPNPAQFGRTLADWGVSDHSLVVVYDQNSAAMAARAWWLLLWAGHAPDRVKVLDGGLDAWCAAGLPLQSGTVPAVDLPPYPVRPQGHMTMDAAGISMHLDDRSILLVDARARDRFDGLVEPIDPVAGHIPGAVNRPFQDNLGPGNRFKDSDTLRAEWSALGGPSAIITATCGSGVTACHHLLALAVAGWGDARLYPGSWSEWITDPARPRA